MSLADTAVGPTGTGGDVGPTSPSRAAQAYVLPPDVVFLPIRDLSPAVRATLDGAEGDIAVARPGFRVPSRLVDEPTATLLEEFREPSTIADAVIRYCRRRHLDPDEVIDAAFPMLQVFSGSRVLVPEGSVDTAGATASLVAGQLFEGLEIVATVQSTFDTEVYRARDGDGRHVALKIESLRAPEGTVRRLERERDVLGRLSDRRADGTLSTPEVLRSGEHDGRRYLVSSWHDGVPLNVRANAIRLEAAAGWRRRLHALACRTVEAFAHLHEAGFVHGDVHANNILVREDDTIVLVDFGLSVRPDDPTTHDDMRVGVTRLLDPQSAAAMARAELPPAMNVAAELYALAGLLFECYTGAPYLEFAADVETVYRQIGEEPPRPFVRCRVEPWPAIERVLHAALAKRPDDRPRGMRRFHRALSRAAPPDVATRDEILDAEIERFVAPFVPPLEELPSVPTLFPTAPSAALDRGCAGYAWFLYRASQLRGCARLASMADVYARRAIEASTRADAFHRPGSGEASVTIDDSSVLHRLPGLYYVHALVCHARGDVAGFHRATERFLRLSDTDGDIADVSFGHAGTALALCNLLGASRSSAYFDGTPLASALVVTLDKLEGLLARGDAPGLIASQPFSFAHGTTGLGHALLCGQRELRRWRNDGSARDVPASCSWTLDEGARRSVVDWVRSCEASLTIDDVDHSTDAPEGAHDGYIPGWCNGVAGLVPFLLLAADEGLHDGAEDVAGRAAGLAERHPDRTAHLCCGVAGRVFALLAMFRHSGEGHWVERARGLATGLLHPSLPTRPEGGHHSLFWGELGCALALEEVRHPEQSVMPVFGDLDW